MKIEEDDYLEHYGKKGMKWGVRRQRRLERATRVASGTASKKDKVGFALTDTSRSSIKRNKGLSGAAASRVRELEARKERIETGKTKVKDIIALYGGDRLWVTGKQ